MNKDLGILTKKEIESKLNTYIGWSYKDNKISKEYSFNSFSDALDFINSLAPFCNKIDHHPDIHIYYKNVIFDLTRYSVGGQVTERDFTVAAEIEKLYKLYSNKK